VQASIEALQPAAVVMVGIAFGVDSKKQKIGDILVSRQLTSYELQRVGTTKGGRQKRIPRGDRAHASVKLVDRFTAGLKDWPGQKVEIGLILSGDKLVDNLQFRQQLLRFEPEAIGGEMEGAGLYAAAQRARVDWILVKAICDWAEHKGRNKKQRQQMAATQRTLTLKSNQERKRLIWHRDHDPKPYVRERCALVIKVADGQSPHWVARYGLLKPRDPDTIYAWLDAYEADGFEGLLAHPPGGYRGANLDEHRAEVEERLRQPPEPSVAENGVASPALAPCRYRLAIVRASFEWLAD
jgi:nucleoside phosphorylase